ncbi:tyrosine--tRNA ligase [Mycoplasmopsis lipofaciens]|uniref:tyrosine--tRNA ligase n=1 Tax=Mycoplasmopsis lipofaciens TaxID=114884 RepID=UPI0004821D3D|nr:tyrosine--tRNA ligase [Mycoplasmopsis lipofaciens]
MTILDELKERKLLKQISNEDKLLKLDPTKIAIYGGFDPTAKSLHLGNYVLICTLRMFQKYGFKTYALIGGATGMIGDPSFKDSERVLLDNKTVLDNKEKIKKQLESFNLEVVDNYDFYKNMSVLDFLRDAGKMVNVSYMMAKESVTRRIERGLSYTEFSYQILQGYDFLTLYRDKNVKIQVGGSDQWGNLITGLDMINTIYGNNHDAVVLTHDLLTDENGNKIGKSTGGGKLWLDKKMTSPYQMYQFLLNQPDSLVEKLLNWITLMPTDEIKNIMKIHNMNPQKHYAQEMLAKEVVKDIFSEQDLKISITLTNILYNKHYSTKEINIDELVTLEKYLPLVEIEKNQNIIDKLIETKHIASKREAREFINSGALKIDGELVNENTLYNPNLFNKKYAFFKKGKKQTILLKTK